MSDIELVIKLPEAEYDLIVNDEACGLNVLTRAIAKGTKLPKGHGILIDADAIINRLCTQEASDFFESVACAEIMEFIDNEEPIVKADVGNGEE